MIFEDDKSAVLRHCRKSCHWLDCIL